MTLPRETRAEAVRAAVGHARLRSAATDLPARQVLTLRSRVRLAAARLYRSTAQWTTVGQAELRLELAQALDTIARLESRLGGLVPETKANTMNQTLLKREFRDVLHRFDELGFAIAPAAGIDGAGVRLAEQREHLNALDRRLRVLDARLTEAIEAAQVGASDGAPPQARASDPVPGFDYVGFERRFRGDPEKILEIQRDRYVPLLADHGPVVDIGCGRGELLDVLAEAGIEGIGVEPEPGMAAEARARGLHIEQTDAVGFLRDAEPGSLGSVFCAHVVEHVELDYLLEFIYLSFSRLKPGGLFVAETPNPASLIVLGNSYILDPTHVRPLHPSLLAFLCENAGFRDVRLNFYSPAESYRLRPTTEGGELATVVNEGFAKLNDVLFGPQEYTVVATKGP